MTRRRGCIASANAAHKLAELLLQRAEKEESDMANKKTAKKKRLKEQKRATQANEYVQTKLEGH